MFGSNSQDTCLDDTYFSCVYIPWRLLTRYCDLATYAPIVHHREFVMLATPFGRCLAAIVRIPALMT
ncbi:1712_t:CDS:1, partial [Funneliformis caledonium]